MLLYTGGAQSGWCKVCTLCSHSYFSHLVALSSSGPQRAPLNFLHLSSRSGKKEQGVFQARFHGSGLEASSFHIILVRTQSYSYTKLESFDPVHNILKIFKVCLCVCVFPYICVCVSIYVSLIFWASCIGTHHLYYKSDTWWRLLTVFSFCKIIPAIIDHFLFHQNFWITL